VVSCIIIPNYFSNTGSTPKNPQPSGHRADPKNAHVHICLDNKGIQIKEITCCNGHVYCDSCIYIDTNRYVTSKFTYADILKIKKEIDTRVDLKYILATSIDLKEIRCHPNINGYSSQYYNILSILHENIIGTSIKSNESKLDNLKSFIKSEGMVSQVGSLSSSNTRVAKDIRNSISLRFSKDLTNKLSDAILPELKDYMSKEFEKNGSNLLEVLPHDHGDMILYENSGEFKLHRDKVPNTKPCESADMFSYILCLDSNLNDRFFSDEGNTLIYNLPWQNGTVESSDNRIDINRRMTVPTSPIKINMIPHLYPETVTPSGFLVFNSRKKHASICINDGLDKNGKPKFKFILKLDFWVIHESKPFIWHDKPSYGLSFIDVLEDFMCADNSIIKNIVKECKCKICNPHHQTILQLMNIVFPKLNQDISVHILSFIDTYTVHNTFSNLVKKPRISYDISTYIKPSSYRDWSSFFENNDMYNDYDNYNDDNDCND